MNTRNDAWGKCLYDEFCPKNFSWTGSLDITQCSNQMTYSICFPIRYYDSSDIKFDMVMKI